MMERFNQLEKREQVMLVCGLLFVIGALFFLAVYEPYQAALVNSEHSIRVKQRQLAEVKQLRAEYLQLQELGKTMDRQLDSNGGVSTLALLEGLVTSVSSREHLSYIRPQPPQTQDNLRIENLDLKLERLSLEQTLRLLWSIETSNVPIQIRNLRIKQRFDDHSLTDTTMTVAVFRKS